MPNFNYITLCLLTSLLCAQTPNTLLWKFYKKGQKPSFLYGTYHSKKVTHDHYHDSLEAIIKQVDRVYVELDEKEMQTATSQMMAKLMLPKGKTLPSIISKEEYNRYVKLAEQKIGEKYYILDFMHPIVVTIILTMSDEAAEGSEDGSQTVDQYIESFAKDNQIEVASLETGDEQIDALKALDIKESAKCLIETVDNFNDARQAKDSLLALYQKQDISGILSYSADPKNKSSMDLIQGPLLDKRNRVMVNRVDTFLKKSQKNTLVAVGSMHLLGKTGLIESLKAKGYTIEPILP